MSTEANFDSILAQVMSLPPDDRIELVERVIVDTPGDPEIEAAQLAEVHRRMQEVREGKAVLIPGDQVMREVSEMLAAVKK